MYTDFKEFMREERKRQGLTQEQLAKRLNDRAGKTVISTYERGTRGIGSKKMIELSAALGIPYIDMPMMSDERWEQIAGSQK